MNGKYSFSLLSLLVMGVNSLHADSDVRCQSHVFVPRSITTDLVYVDSLNFYRRHHQDRDKSVIYTATLLGQQSTKSAHLGSAFLLGNGSNLVRVAQNAPADINSEFFGLTNLDDNFSETFAIRPERKVMGYHGNWYFNLNSWWCGLWADVSSAILNVRHDLNCKEDGNFAEDENGIRTFSDALADSRFRFGKFFCGLCDDEKRRTGIDDVQLRLGYDYNWCDAIIGFYGIATVPTGRKPTAEFVFEPLVGTRHWSAGVGLTLDYDLSWCGCCDDTYLTLLSDINYRFVFSHKECRTFDLIPNGAFSRFLPVATRTNPTVQLPGVNFLTQKVDVKPRSTIQWWLALNYEYCNWDLELGYNLFWRQKERIKASSLHEFNPTIGIFDLNCEGLGCTTASTATIGTFDIVANQTFVPLTLANINVDSAVAGRVLSNKFYLAVATDGCYCDCINWFVGLGGSYEFVSKHDRCNALPYWAAFAKGGIAF